MILDASAILAIVFAEPGYEDLVAKAATRRTWIGTPTACETGIVLMARLGAGAAGMLERFLQEFRVESIPFTEEHWREAISAFERFGKGRHRAGLNFGDCMCYATAILSGQPLLFVGNDFSETDVDPA